MFIEIPLNESGERGGISTAFQLADHDCHRSAGKQTAIGILYKNPDFVPDFQHPGTAQQIHRIGNGLTADAQFIPEDGMKVTAHGRISSFVRDGTYQLYCDGMEPDGVGALYIAFEQLKKKLELKIKIMESEK